jgi:hypothetical protein
MVEWKKRLFTISIVVPSLYMCVKYKECGFFIAIWFSLVAQLEYNTLIFKIINLFSVGEQEKSLTTHFERSKLIKLPVIIFVFICYYYSSEYIYIS